MNPRKVPKFFFTDTETNGLNPKIQSPWQIAGIIRSKDMKFDKEINITMQPFDVEASEPKALELGRVNGEPLTKELLYKMQPSLTAFKELSAFLAESCDQFNKLDKMIIVGYNVEFDKGMLYHFWKRNNNNYFFSFFHKYVIDVYQFVQPLWLLGMIDTPNCQLGTICEYYDIKIDAHDAMSDIKATMELFYKIVAPYFRTLLPTKD